MFAGLDWLAVLGGLAVGFGVMMVIAIIIAIVEFASIHKETGLDVLEDEESFNKMMEERLLKDTHFQVAILILSLLTDMLGGYYTARWADHSPYLHAGIMGAFGIALSWSVDWRSVTPLWHMLAWTLLGIPAALLGAWFCCPA